MRRTAAIQITLLSAASLALVACGEDATQNDTLFATRDACIRAYGDDGRAACEEAFRAAQVEHFATAPQFPDQAGCEAQTGGACQMASKPGLAAFAVPVMAGVLIGRALSDGGARPVMPVYGGGPQPCPPGATTPECQPRSGSSSSGSGSRFNWYYGGSQIGTTAAATGDARALTPSAGGTQAMARMAGTTSRGGLGSAGRGFASVGS